MEDKRETAPGEVVQEQLDKISNIIGIKNLDDIFNKDKKETYKKLSKDISYQLVSYLSSLELPYSVACYVLELTKDSMKELPLKKI